MAGEYFELTAGADGSPQFRLWGDPVTPNGPAFLLGGGANTLQTTDMIVDMFVGNPFSHLKGGNNGPVTDRKGRKVHWE